MEHESLESEHFVCYKFDISLNPKFKSQTTLTNSIPFIDVKAYVICTGTFYYGH